MGRCQSNSLNTAAPPERMPSNGINKSLRSLCSLIADFCNRIGHKRTCALQQIMPPLVPKADICGQCPLRAITRLVRRSK